MTITIIRRPAQAVAAAVHAVNHYLSQPAPADAAPPQAAPADLPIPTHTPGPPGPPAPANPFGSVQPPFPVPECPHLHFAQAQDAPVNGHKPAYSILTALAELPTRGQALMLVHRVTQEGYLVLSYDAQTRRVRLKGPNGQQLRPCVSEREAAIYEPLWR